MRYWAVILCISVLLLISLIQIQLDLTKVLRLTVYTDPRKVRKRNFKFESANCQINVRKFLLYLNVFQTFISSPVAERPPPPLEPCHDCLVCRQMPYNIKTGRLRHSQSERQQQICSRHPKVSTWGIVYLSLCHNRLFPYMSAP